MSSMKYPYRDLGVPFDRNFRNDLNANFDDIEHDIRMIGGEAAQQALEAAEEANTQAIYAQTSGDYANDKGDYAAQQGDYAQTQGNFANEKGLYAQQQGDYAKAQGDYAKQVGDENKTRWLTAVNTYADIAATYPNPQLGDTVQTIDDSKIYRWDGTQWVWTQQYNANAITDVQNKIGILSNDIQSRGINVLYPPAPFVACKGDGITDDTDAIQALLDTGLPLFFPKPSVGYKFSRTLVPKHNKSIVFEAGAKLIADPNGTYTEMIQYPSTPLGLYVLFDTSRLGNLIKDGHNRFGTLVRNLRIDGSNIPNSVGIGPTVEWDGTEAEATEPINRFEGAFIERCTWGIYYPTAVVSHIGGGVGTIFDQPTVKTVNGIYLGANQDDIVINSPRIYGTTGIGLCIKGHNKCLNAVFIRPSGGVGLQVESATFGNVINGLFIEANVDPMPSGSIPILLNGNNTTNSDWAIANITINGLTINFPDGTPSNWQTWIKLNGRYDRITINGLVHKDWNKVRNYTHIIEYSYGTGSIMRGSSFIDYQGEIYDGFIKNNYAVDNYDYWVKWIRKVRVHHKKGSGIFYGDIFIEDGQSEIHVLATDVDRSVYLDGYGMKGASILNTSTSTVGVNIKAINPNPNQKYFLENNINSAGNIVINNTAYVQRLTGKETLLPGQTAIFQWRQSDNKFVQLTNI